MLGTDRRDPPSGPFDDLVADTLRAVPSERMLAQVAACTAVRRAGVLPGPPEDRLQPPPTDDRPACTPAAVERWYHVTTSWPVLEDEWMLTLITNGWRVAPELVPPVLWRHRSDPVRRARAEIGLRSAGRLARVTPARTRGPIDSRHHRPGGDRRVAGAADPARPDRPARGSERCRCCTRRADRRGSARQHRTER